MKVNINVVSLAYARVAGRRHARRAIVSVSHERVFFPTTHRVGAPSHGCECVRE